MQDPIRNIASIFLIFFIGGCASIQAPTGGDKDEKAPEVVTTVPVNKTTNYKGKEIKVQYNEDIEIINLKNNLIISPYTEIPYTSKVNKNTLTLNFESPLKDSTTYTLNFVNAIKDITEGNINKNIQLTFSTGSELDSLSIKGSVRELMTDKVLENTVVTLYSATDTFTVKKHKPAYFTRVDSSGNFAINNIKENSYNIYAFQDLNNNLKFDEQAEKISFLNTPIQLDSNRTNLLFKISSQDERPLKVLRHTQANEQYEIEFNKNIIDAKITKVASKDTIPVKIGESKNKLTLYNTQPNYDSLQVNVSAIDSMGIVLNDTIVKIIFRKPKADTLDNLSYQANPERGGQIREQFKIEINTGEPIRSFNKAGISAIADSITPVALNTILYRDKIEVIGSATDKAAITLILADKTITGVTGRTNKADTLEYTFTKESNTGDISGQVNNAKTPVIIELLNENYTVVQTLNNTTKFSFKNLVPQKYYIRIIEDANNNGKWDSGSLEKKTLPEKISFYPGLIEVRSNWEIENISIDL